MSPIAPRYRGPDASSDDSQPALSPILKIPNLTPEDQVVTYSGVLSDVSVENAPDATTEAHSEIPSPEQGGLQPVLGSMQESIKRITDTATRSIKRVGDGNKTFSPVETVRGVLPGIVISISIICLWWIIGRSSPAPLRPDIARESQSGQESINPIASDPLRVAEKAKDTRADNSPSVATDASSDEQLFDHVPFINRPTNETVSQSDATQEAPTSAPPTDGPQAEARPAPSQSSFPPAVQSEIAEAQPNPRSPRDQMNVQQRTDRPRTPVRVADRSTEFEWQRGSQGRRAPDPQRVRTVEQRRAPQATAQRKDRNRTTEDRQPRRTYSYQQTDPSTYKDPVYNVPPVARRARAAQR